jgi:hypothetical protein
MTRKELANLLNIDVSDAGKISLSKGVFTLRREYFYRSGKTPQKVFSATLAKLKENGVKISNVEYGDKFASFKSGKGVRSNSHFWVSFEIK